MRWRRKGEAAGERSGGEEETGEEGEEGADQKNEDGRRRNKRWRRCKIIAEEEGERGGEDVMLRSN